MNTLEKVQHYSACFLYELKARLSRIPNDCHYDVPYQSQFATPELAEPILLNQTPLSADTNWSQIGAESPEEYQRWVFTMCGMACTSMALKYFTNIEIPPVTLARDALANGVYQLHQDHLSSLRYSEFTKWLPHYGLKAEQFRFLTIAGIEYSLAHGDLVIVSVNPNIRGISTVEETQVGGHLVLVVGYDHKTKHVLLHNPSGFVCNQSQKYHAVSLSHFSRFFARRGIVVSRL